MIVVLAAGGVISLAVDMPVGRFVEHYVQPLDDKDILEQLVVGFKGFAELVPILMIGWLILRVDRRRGGQAAVRLIVAVILASMVSGGFKAFVGRHRPEPFQGETLRQTWVDVGLADRDSKQQSFFSGHTTAAFAMATVLSGYYPVAGPVVFTLAAGCGASRVMTEQHWVSDVYVGSLAGIALGWILLPGRLRRSRQGKELLTGKLNGQLAGV
jgi:membrane-associated phospholipid phosphatase